MPRANRTSGRMQHDEAASAPSTPPAAIHAGPRPELLAVFSSLIAITSRVHPVATTGSRTLCMRPITALRADGVPIGELSRRTGVNIETIRYYEKIKMLPAPGRTAGGHRVYGPQQARILAFIRRGRELGFTLDEIRALLDLAGPGRASCAEVRVIAKRH